uniref:Uncharacterized protein n=1 Tax=Oryza meridionalis TaxID=40149 RepID=A0A0E0D0F8_9ORYZ
MKFQRLTQASEKLARLRHVCQVTNQTAPISLSPLSRAHGGGGNGAGSGWRVRGGGGGGITASATARRRRQQRRLRRPAPATPAPDGGGLGNGGRAPASLRPAAASATPRQWRLWAATAGDGGGCGRRLLATAAARRHQMAATDGCASAFPTVGTRQRQIGGGLGAPGPPTGRRRWRLEGEEGLGFSLVAFPSPPLSRPGQASPLAGGGQRVAAVPEVAGGQECPPARADAVLLQLSTTPSWSPTPSCSSASTPVTNTSLHASILCYRLWNLRCRFL